MESRRCDDLGHSAKAVDRSHWLRCPSCQHVSFRSCTWALVCGSQPLSTIRLQGEVLHFAPTPSPAVANSRHLCAPKFAARVEQRLTPTACYLHLSFFAPPAFHSLAGCRPPTRPAIFPDLNAFPFRAVLRLTTMEHGSTPYVNDHLFH